MKERKPIYGIELSSQMQMGTELKEVFLVDLRDLESSKVRPVDFFEARIRFNGGTHVGYPPERLK